MPPRSRPRSRASTASASERVTRSQARSDSSRDSSEAAGIEDMRASGVAKPDIDAERSHAYGSPPQNKNPKQMATQVRQRALENLIGDAVKESEHAIAHEPREPSVAGSRLSDIEETNAEDDSTIQGSPRRPLPVGYESISFNVEAPVARSAGFDAQGNRIKPDRLSARNLRRINRDSTTSNEEYVEQVIEKMSSSYDTDIPPRSSMSNLTKLLMFGIVLALTFMTLSSKNIMTDDLKGRVHSILSPSVPNPLGNWTNVSDYLGGLAKRVETVESSFKRFNHDDTGIWPRMESVKQNIDKIWNQVNIVDRRVRQLQDQVNDRQQDRHPGVNAFAVASGLFVDPYLTSPTKEVQEKYRIGPWVRRWLGAPVIKSKTPYAAFEPWEDYGECWCATATDGHAQISVILPRGVAPLRLAIEHIGTQQTPNPGSTPKDFELWAEVKDEVHRRYAEHVTNEHYGEPTERHYSLPTLSDDWIRVLSGMYDTNAPNRKQTFELPEHFREWYRKRGHGVYPRRYTLRINTIYDAETDHMCLYRIKLFGYSLEHKELVYDVQSGKTISRPINVD